MVAALNNNLEVAHDRAEPESPRYYKNAFERLP